MKAVQYFSSNVNLREQSNEYILSGLAIPYDSWSHILYNDFREKFLKGAFTRALENNKDILAFAHHDSKQVLGRTSASTLTLDEREEGIYVEINMPNTTYSKDLIESVRRRDITGFSFAYEVLDYNMEEWNYNKEDRIYEHIISESALYEVSPVSLPAYPQTQMNLRSMLYEKEYIHKRCKDVENDRLNKIKQRDRMLKLLSLREL